MIVTLTELTYAEACNRAYCGMGSIVKFYGGDPTLHMIDGVLKQHQNSLPGWPCECGCKSMRNWVVLS